MRKYLFFIGVAFAMGASFLVMRGEAVSMVGYVDYTPLYSPAMARAGGMQIEVHGSPVKGASPEEIAASVPIPGWIGGGTPRLFTGKPGRGAGNRIVLVFNSSPVPNQRMCIAPEEFGGKEGAGPLTVAAIFCSGRRKVSTAGLSGGDISSLQDAAYRSGMSQMMAQLLPSRNPETMMPGGN